MVHFYKVHSGDASAAAAVPEPCFDSYWLRTILLFQNHALTTTGLER